MKHLLQQFLQIYHFTFPVTEAWQTTNNKYYITGMRNSNLTSDVTRVKLLKCYEMTWL